MAMTLTIQPKANRLCSTLIPISFNVYETTSNTTNIIAKCFVQDQTTGVATQVGGEYRCAPSLANADVFKFDASEIYNTVTKYTLIDFPSNFVLGELNTVLSNTVVNWEDVAVFKCYVYFYREYLDATTGLIEVDPLPKQSNTFYVHEGCPEQAWLDSAVSSNSIDGSTFFYFNLNWSSSGAQYKRFFTNYPISVSGGKPLSKVTIKPTESYMLMCRPLSTTYCGYRVSIKTFGASGTLNTHYLTLTETRNVVTFMCGFKDIIDGLTANGAEGTDFENVLSYQVGVEAGTVTTAPCAYTLNSTLYSFTVDRSCNGKGYLRFAFKNMLGGYDMVTSDGSYRKTIKNDMLSYTKSTGYNNWNNAMDYGAVNFANESVIKYSVTTHPMRKEYAEHFIEMLSSTDVYLRHKNTANKKVVDSDLAVAILEQPNWFKPIKINQATTEIVKTTENVYRVKFNFEQSINQRTPRL